MNRWYLNVRLKKTLGVFLYYISLQGHSEVFRSNSFLYWNLRYTFNIIFRSCCTSYAHFFESQPKLLYAVFTLSQPAAIRENTFEAHRMRNLFFTIWITINSTLWLLDALIINHTVSASVSLFKGNNQVYIYQLLQDFWLSRWFYFEWIKVHFCAAMKNVVLH